MDVQPVLDTEILKLIMKRLDELETRLNNLIKRVSDVTEQQDVYLVKLDEEADEMDGRLKHVEGRVDRITKSYWP